MMACIWGLVNQAETGLIRLEKLGISVQSLGELIGEIPHREKLEAARFGDGDDAIDAVEFFSAH